MSSPADAPIAVAPPRLEGRRVHARIEDYRSWLREYVPHEAARWERLRAYRRFTETWPDLEDWFAAPLPVRLGFTGGELRTGRTQMHRANGYLIYLSLVGGVGLDFDLLLGRKYTRPFSVPGGGNGLGVDLAMFDRWVARMVELGYPQAGARGYLMWALGRLVLHRGDPDLTAITADDLFALGNAVRDFGARPDYQQLRRALFTVSGAADTGHTGDQFIRTHLAKLHAAHVLLFNEGQVGQAPQVGTRQRTGWTDRLLPEPCPPAIRAVVERYLRLRLEAKFDRPQTVRLTREGLRRLVNWLAKVHPEIANLRQLNRPLIEDYLQWLPGCISQQTGQPLTPSTVASAISAVGAFCRDTAVWGWTDVPGRPLITTRDTPKQPKPLPRFLPADELAAIMTAIDALADPAQRAALLLLRWSGARRDEIRRLTWDCLDHDLHGNPRLRIPVGKSYTERIVPLHPDAAAALRGAIDAAKAQNAIARHDQHASRAVNYVFMRHGKLLSKTTLFDDAFRTVCSTAGLLDAHGVPKVSAHRFRHTLGTQLAEGGARIQTIMAILGHRSAEMSLIYARISDPEIRRQYETALAGGGRIAGPAADALLHDTLDEQAVHWLQTNFLKTELELGHCLRLPAEGPCECDLVLTCPKFLTSTEYIPRLQTRMIREAELIADAEHRGWEREAERHRCTQQRIAALLQDLSPDGCVG